MPSPLVSCRCGCCLQPRDYINSLLLYLGVGAMYVGLFVARPAFVAPAVDVNPAGAPSMFPFVFIVIACGAASGFHCLVSSGTSAKQLNRETDARFVGYGAMIGESLLGLMAVLACTAGFVSREEWLDRYASWQAADTLGNNIGAFIGGTTRFLGALGLPAEIASTFVAVLVVSFALTSLDSATRLLRYNISEIGETLRVQALGSRYVASGLAVTAIWFFAFYEVAGESAGLMLWSLFGTTNQLMAGLALLTITIYLVRRGETSPLYAGADAFHARLDAVRDGKQPDRLLVAGRMDPVWHWWADLCLGGVAHPRSVACRAPVPTAACRRRSRGAVCTANLTGTPPRLLGHG